MFPTPLSATRNSKSRVGPRQLGTDQRMKRKRRNDDCAETSQTTEDKHRGKWTVSNLRMDVIERPELDGNGYGKRRYAAWYPPDASWKKPETTRKLWNKSENDFQTTSKSDKSENDYKIKTISTKSKNYLKITSVTPSPVLK